MREAQRSEPNPKENKPRKQVQGDHERKRNGRPKRLEVQKKKHQEGKETHGKRLKKNSKDSQQPPRDVDPSKRISIVKGRLRQFERKGQEKKIRNRVEATSAKRPSKKEEITSDLSWRKWQASRGTRMEKYEKGNGNGRLSNQ